MESQLTPTEYFKYNIYLLINVEERLVYVKDKLNAIYFNKN